MGINTQTIGLAIGWLLVGWVGLQGLNFTVRTARRRARWHRDFELERADFRRRVEAAARAARASKAIADWSGWRPFRVAAIVDEAVDVKSFYFTPVDGRPLLPFAPGQYLTFRLPLIGTSAPLVRCYSMSGRPQQDYYRATIKRIAAPSDRPTAPPGRGSNYFHDNVRVGDVLEVRAPGGTFLIDPLAGEPVALIGAGIGVTPLVSMLDACVHSGQRREIYAIFGFRNGREHPFKDHLQRLAETNPWIHLQVSYSAPLSEDVLYKDYNHRGRLSFDRLRAVLPSNNFHYYVCGPSQMMESLVPALWDWGVPESHVHFEAFGPASVKCGGTVQSRGRRAEPCEVRFERAHWAVVWDGSFTSLLEFGEAAGIAMPSGCRAGSCGECMLAVRSGAVTNLKQPSISVPAGHCLTCISEPAGALVLDA
ncbi:MAG: FAD-binding oxidoreductase [Planctomycetes bacterium]|nr:FAD-binding oxidoreductase [Planctomycetota bacterium]